MRFVDLGGLGALLSILVLAHPAVATPIAFSITGTLTQVSDPEAALDPSVAIGAPFSGLVSYEPPGVTQRGSTAFPAPPAVISLVVGTLFVSSGASAAGQLVITVQDGTYFGPAYQEPNPPPGSGGDRIGFGISSPGSNGPAVDSLAFDFVDPTGQAVSGLSVPTGPLDLELLAGSLRLVASGLGGPAFGVAGTVDSVAFVPEPGTWLLFAAGLGLLGAARAGSAHPRTRRRRG